MSCLIPTVHDNLMRLDAALDFSRTGRVVLTRANHADSSEFLTNQIVHRGA